MVLCILSWAGQSRAASAYLAASRAGTLLTRIVAVDDASQPDTIDYLLDHDEICGCVLVVSDLALKQPSFSEVVRACMLLMSRRADFRLFVHLHGLSYSELHSHATTAVQDLMDTVHFPPIPDRLDELERAIHAYLLNLPQIRDRMRFLRLKAAGCGLLRLFDLAQAGLMFWGIAYLAIHYQDGEALRSAWLPWILAGLGEMLFYSVLCLLSLGTPVGAGGSLRWGVILASPWFLRWIPMATLLHSWRYIAGGFGLGFLMDTVRRYLAQEKRRRVAVELTGAEFTPGQCRYHASAVPALGLAPRVLISYARSSEWGSRTAFEIQSELTSCRIPSFVDVGMIVGTSWRHKLMDELAAATVFVSVQDEITAPRYWPAAELEAALRGQENCGTPLVIVVRHPEMAVRELPAGTPGIVESVVHPRQTVDGSLLRVIDFTEDMPRQLARGLVYHRSVSLLGRGVGGAIYVVFMWPRIVMATLGTLGTAAGWLIAVLLYFQHSTGFDTCVWLNDRSMTEWAVLLAAFWLGFTVELWVSSRFRLNAPEARGLATVNLAAAVGLAGAIVYVLKCSAPFAYLWALVGSGLGFLLAQDAVGVSFKKRDLSRRSPV